MKHFAVVALLLLAGCSGLEPRESLPPPPPEKAAGVLALDVPRVAYEPSDPERPASGRWYPKLDVKRVQERMGALCSLRGVAQTFSLEEGDDRKRAPLVLDVSIEEAVVRYEGQTGIFPFKVGVLVCLFPLDVPNYFISSDRFVFATRARWKLVDTASGQDVATGEVVGRQVGRFGDFSRGWYFLGFVRVPACLSNESWEEIASQLSGGGEAALAEAIVAGMEKDLVSKERH